METFFTVTDKDTCFTNSRSKRYPTFAEAEAEARCRLTLGGRDASGGGVYIMQAVALVELAPRPTTTTKLIK